MKNNAGFQTIALTRIHESTTNPRSIFDESKLAELAASLRTQGLIQPITVRPNSDGYEIVAGARRFRAAHLAELTELPVRIVQLSDEQSFEWQIIENSQRVDVHPYEEAQGSLVELHPDNRVVELSFVSSTPFILCRGRSLSEPAVLHKRTNVSCGFIPPRAG
jgi:ParB/RepB/Spo0J family partition protein